MSRTTKSSKSSNTTSKNNANAATLTSHSVNYRAEAGEHMTKGSMTFSGPQMSKDIRPLVLPSQLLFKSSRTDRYVPRFSRNTNTAWWELYDPNPEAEGWVNSTSERRNYNRKMRIAAEKALRDQQSLVGDNEDEEDGENGNIDEPIDEEEERRNMTFLQVEAQAWKSFHDENSRRERLIDAWMSQYNSH